MLEKYYQNYPKFNNILIDKFNTFYTIICPNDKIFITYYKISKNGSKTNPAPLINKIKSMYKELTVYTKENLNNSVNLRSLTYNHYLTNANTELKNYLKTYFANHPDYQKYNKLIAYTPSFYDVDNVNLNDIKQLSLSPSSMDIYNYCPFQYFCKYILKLDKKESFKYDNRIVGTYIHYMFQNLISNCATKDNIMGLLNFWKQEFIKQENINLTATINYLFDKLNNRILKLWPLVYDEINNNKFEPSEVELNLSTSANFPPVVLNYKNIPIYLRGFIDRVDLYNNYVRIIDYKTGSKVINLNDIAHKLNLQLFIYLLFIKHSKPDLLPAAMFYMPSLVKYEEAEFNPQHYRLTGMLIDNKNVIDGLGGENINTYIDAYTRQKFKDTVLISEQEMDEMLKFTEKATIKTASNIIDGHISISPLKGKDLCKYCHYQAICGIEEGSQNYRKFKKYSKEEIWELIRGEMKWTDDQKLAIESRGGKIIVSAAAGSGKTAVLSARIIDYIINGGSVDKLLVVTFTNLAAGEMKERIRKNINQAVQKDPNNAHLHEQLLLVDLAQIMTMDAFYNKLIKLINKHFLFNFLNNSINVQTACHMVGLNYSRFSRNFDKITPSLYRKKYRIK